MHKVNVGQSAGVELVRSPREITLEQLNPKGRFKLDHYRDGKRIDSREFPNGITNEGKNFLLDVMFHGTSAIGTWYLGLIDNSGYSALSANDIYDNIDQSGNGWDEFKTYTDPANSDSTTSRPAWTEGASSGQVITNSSVVVFDITGTATVKGVFLCGGTNAQSKGDNTAGSAHKLWATALFTGGDVSVLNGDQLKLTYSVSA